MTSLEVDAEPGALRCSVQRRAAGGLPIGSTPSSVGLLLVEVPLPWPADVAEATSLRALAEVGVADGYRLQALVPAGDVSPGQVRIIRYSRPEGPFDRYRRMERVAPADDLVVAVAELVEAPLPAVDAGPAVNGSGVSDVLVCTHGSRDTCCGRSGMRLYQELQSYGLPGLRVWRTSHLGGHRFAPTAMTLPDGRAWAWLDGPTMTGIVRRDLPVEVAAEHDRGCAGMGSPAAQAAEHAVFAREGWAWLDRARTVDALPAGDRAAARQQYRVMGEATAQAEPLAYEVEVEVARTLPVPVCGEPLDAAIKTEHELRVVGAQRLPL